MKTGLATATLLLAAASLAHAADVGVSIAISQPGVYGRIDIGRFPQPAVVVARPVIIAPPAVAVVGARPVYMWVPPGHRKHWAKHCGRYNACGVPVYFVKSAEYEPGYEHPGKGKGKGRGKGRD